MGKGEKKKITSFQLFTEKKKKLFGVSNFSIHSENVTIKK